LERECEAFCGEHGDPLGDRSREKPDFNGHWVLTETDDMEELLNEKGIGWVQRQAAKAANYGVGRMEVEIKQTGDDFVLEVKGMKSFTDQFTANGKEHLGKSPDGNDALVTPFWERKTTGCLS